MKKFGFLTLGLSGCALATIVVVISLLTGAPKSQVNDLRKQGQKLLEQLEYEEGIKILEEALVIEPDNEKVIAGLADGYQSYAESEENAGHIASALVLLDKGFEKTGRESLAQTRDELEKKATGIEKYWYLKRKLEKRYSIHNRILKLPTEYLEIYDAHCSITNCAYHWTYDERKAWKDQIEELEEYRQYLLANNMRINEKEWKEREDLPEDVSCYLNYYEACEWLRDFYLWVNDLDGATVMWREMVSNPDNKYILQDHEYVSSMISEGTGKDQGSIDELKRCYDDYGREVHYDHYHNGVIHVTIDEVYEGNAVKELVFTNLGYFEKKRCYYDEEGRLEEIYMDAGGDSIVRMQYVLQFTYYEDGIVRVDLDIYNLGSGKQESYSVLRKVSEYGDLIPTEEPSDVMPPRNEKMIREQEVDSVKETCDINKNGYLSQKEIDRVFSIQMNNTEKWSSQYLMPCFSIKGIEYFTELKTFRCNFSQLESADFGQNKKEGVSK